MYESRVAPPTESLERIIATVQQLPAELDDPATVALIAQLERLKAACCAAQAIVSAAMLTRSVTADGGRKVPRGEAAVRRNVAAEVALARRESPAAGQKLLRMADMLATDLPSVTRALRDGETSEYRVALLTQELSVLERADRRVADQLLAPSLARLGNLGTLNKAKAIAAELDVAAVVRRNSKALADRTVTIRPAPDMMVRISALLPVVSGVATYAALRTAADAAKGRGDARSRGQLMADGLVAAVTGALSHQPFVPSANPSPSPGVGQGGRDRRLGAQTGSCSKQPTDPAPRIPVCGQGGLPAGLPGARISLHLVMSDRTLLDNDNEPAQPIGYGPVPAPLARRILGADKAVKIWVKRLYRPPGRRRLVDMDSRSRSFPAAMRDFLLARDRVCRTPFCDAPIRHADHVRPVHDGGHTHLGNGQSKCQTCNLVKEFPGWQSDVVDDGDIAVTTPAGQRYLSLPPDPPCPEPGPSEDSRRARTARGEEVTGGGRPVHPGEPPASNPESADDDWPDALPSWARAQHVFIIGSYRDDGPDDTDPGDDKSDGDGGDEGDEDEGRQIKDNEARHDAA